MPEITAWYPKDFLLRQGQTLPEVLEHLNTATREVQRQLEASSEAALQQPVSAGRWSRAQIADHLVLANQLFSQAFQQRLTLGTVLEMERGQVTDDGRAISPAAEEPRQGRTRDQLILDLQDSLFELVRLAQRASDQAVLETVCIHQSFFGPMTGLELLRLAAWHVRHHGKQLAITA